MYDLSYYEELISKYVKILHAAIYINKISSILRPGSKNSTVNQACENVSDKEYKVKNYIPIDINMCLNRKYMKMKSVVQNNCSLFQEIVLYLVYVSTKTVNVNLNRRRIFSQSCLCEIIYSKIVKWSDHTNASVIKYFNETLREMFKANLMVLSEMRIKELVYNEYKCLNKKVFTFDTKQSMGGQFDNLFCLSYYP